MAHATQPTVETPRKPLLYGLLAEYEDPDTLIAAAKSARSAGYRRVDAYTPFPVPGLPEALRHRDQWVPLLMLLGGFAGAAGGAGLLYFTMVLDYPVNIGGRPLWGWPSAIPIVFETTILLSALAGVVGMLLLNGLPQPHHPLFDAPSFARATSDRFFLCIETTDPQFDPEATARFLEETGARQVTEVERKK